MAEEETPSAPAADTKPEAESSDSKPENGKGRKNREDQVPVEELFDLTQPIPRVEKPDKAAIDEKLNAMNEQFEKLKEERKQIQDKIEAALTSGKGSEMGKARDAMAVLRQKKGDLINEKKAIRDQLDSLKNQADKLVKDKKDAKSNIRFNSAEEIDAEVARLQKQQETTSMSLNEEKRLIKEMDALKASKDKIKDVKSKETDLDSVKKKRTEINESIKAKDKEIDAVTKEQDEVGAKIKAMSEKETDKKSVLDALFKERDKLKKDISVVLKEKDAVRDDFRDKTNAWWNYQRAIKAQKKIQYDEDKKKRDEERETYLKQQEEEEAKKIPYEEEQALCDYLADYLERKYITGETGGSSSKVVAKKEDIVAVKEDPFAGMKAVVKDTDEEYFGKGKGKKKRQRAPKKPESSGPFTLNVDSFEQFGLIGMNPPTNLEMVPQSVKELREKKEWYKKQARGSVPTAKDIRKQNERNAAKVRQNSGPGASSGPSAGANGTGFSPSSEEFVPLGKGSSASVDASSWGQKPATSAEPSEVAAPAEES